MVDAIRAHPVIAMMIAILLLGGVPSLVWALWPESQRSPSRQSRDARYATQSGSRDGARRANIDQRGDEAVDSALEACGGIGLPQLAAKYGLPPDPNRVAARFASSYEAAYRRRVRGACLRGLLYGG